MTHDQLKTWRIARNWTVEQAAEYLGAHAATYRNWEAGRRAPPSVVARLLSVLEIMEIMAPALHATMLPADPPGPRKRAQ